MNASLRNAAVAMVLLVLAILANAQESSAKGSSAVLERMGTRKSLARANLDSSKDVCKNCLMAINRVIAVKRTNVTSGEVNTVKFCGTQKEALDWIALHRDDPAYSDHVLSTDVDFLDSSGSRPAQVKQKPVPADLNEEER